MKNPQAEAPRWIAQARDDLQFVRRILEEDNFYDKGCFMAQQSAEKALKACLYNDGERTVLGHSVAELVNRVSARHSSFKSLEKEARLLDRFYIPTRYPNGLPGGIPFETFVLEDLEQAVSMAEKIISAVEGILVD